MGQISLYETNHFETSSLTKLGIYTHCRSCPTTPSSPSPSENLEHILCRCEAYRSIRERIATEYKYLCSLSKTNLEFDKMFKDDKIFCQFVLDPSSFNLEKRIHLNDPILDRMFHLSRDYCFAINSARMNILKNKQNIHKSSKVVTV